MQFFIQTSTCSAPLRSCLITALTHLSERTLNALRRMCLQTDCPETKMLIGWWQETHVTHWQMYWSAVQCSVYLLDLSRMISTSQHIFSYNIRIQTYLLCPGLKVNKPWTSEILKKSLVWVIPWNSIEKVRLFLFVCYTDLMQPYVRPLCY